LERRRARKVLRWRSYASALAGPTRAALANAEDDAMPSDPMPTRPSHPRAAKSRADTTSSVPAKPDHGENSASTLIEAPQMRRRRLDPHDFPDGGGSGGAEAYRRSRVK
jgi:hypothetical protein